jgi:hypothetical protein
MKNAFTKTIYKIDAFSTSKIIFDESDLVSLNVKCRIDNIFSETTLLFPFSKFNDLLRFSGVVGEKLQLKVSDKLLSNGEQPYIIDLINDNIIFTNCSLELAHLQDGDSTFFCVEEITPLSFLEQTKNLRTNMRDFHSVELKNDFQQNLILVEFAQMYIYYKGLIELNISENAAREKAGLQNDKLFKMAYCAALPQNSKAFNPSRLI